MKKNLTLETVAAPAEHHMVIRPQRNLLDLRLGELWQARDLILLFVRRDFVSQYKQTILGPLWYLIQPFLTTIVFTFLFSSIAKLSTDNLPPYLFYLSGTVVFAYFATCLTKTSETFIGNTHLFGKVYFPRLAVPVSILISTLIAFGIQFGFFLAFMGYYALAGKVLHPNIWILFTPVLLLIMAGLGLGLGIIVSSVTTKYRDLRFLVQFGVQLLQFVTPVIVPFSAMPTKYQSLVRLNPLTPIIETFRHAFLGSGTVDLGQLAYSFGIMLVFLIIGVVLFNQVEASFMDTV